MKIFSNKIFYGDTCSGKTFFYKKVNFKKIDTDYLLLFKNIKLKFELFFRKIEFFFVNFFNIIEKKLFLGGGGIILKCIKKILIFKNNNIKNIKKRLIFDNNNRPTLKNNKYLKIRFVIRKKKYIKLYNICLKKCLKCNMLIC